MKSSSYDSFAEPKPKRKLRPLKETITLYRLRDPATGLFLRSAYSYEPHFHTVGVSWKQKPGAIRAWNQYLKDRIISRDGGPMELEIVEFEVKETAKGVVNVRPSPMATISGMISLGNGSHVINNFMDAIVSKGYVATHIFECCGDEKMQPPTSGRYFSNYRPPEQSWNRSELQGHLMIASPSDKDTVYLKMELADYIVAEWNLAEIVQRYQSGDGVGPKLKRRAG